MTKSPIVYDPSFEVVPDDEAETERGLTDAMLDIQRKTFADRGHAYRAVHAKAHGDLEARFEVFPDLAAPFAQGLFAKPNDGRHRRRLCRRGRQMDKSGRSGGFRGMASLHYNPRRGR